MTQYFRQPFPKPDRNVFTLLCSLPNLVIASGVTRVEISGFEVIGPNGGLTKGEATADRLLHSKKFSGRE